MKKVLGFMGVAALLALGSCANENFDGPESPEAPTGDMFITMNISQLSPAGTRTSTPSQGVEIGKDRENQVTHALIMFAKPDQNVYKVFKAFHVGTLAGTSSGTQLNGGNGNYSATFEMKRDDFLKDIEDNGENGELAYAIFVVANPSTDMIPEDLATLEGQPVQKLFTLENDGDTYWTANNFLMSNSGVIDETNADEPNHGIYVKKIKASEIPVGTHTTEGTAYNLGSVRIQRAMSRFDIEVSDAYTEFTADNANNELKDIKITVTGVSLVNQASTANLFKVTGTEDLNPQATTLNFTLENATNWVWSPKQTAFTLPLFTGNIENGRFVDDAKKVDVKGLTYTTISEIKGRGDEYKDEDYTHPTNTVPANQGDYMIWRYAMENTNPNTAAGQMNGNSTGIVFKTEMTSSTITTEGGNDIALYAFNDVILGKDVTLRDFANKPKSESDQTGVYELVNIRYFAAVKAYNLAQTDENKKFLIGEEDKVYEEGTAPAGIPLSKASTDDLKALDKYLVAQDFTIYRPDENGKYFCYYTYWNRHNDNGLPTEMGEMEFATVRNNVYKIRVEKIHKLGHPGVTDDDPDPETPPTPDEKDHFYFSVSCEILPWEVRMNGVEL